MQGIVMSGGIFFFLVFSFVSIFFLVILPFLCIFFICDFFLCAFFCFLHVFLFLVCFVIGYGLPFRVAIYVASVLKRLQCCHFNSRRQQCTFSASSV